MESVEPNGIPSRVTQSLDNRQFGEQRPPGDVEKRLVRMCRLQ
jgi:hypothetical protein